ncbi:hypothetical protein [Leuconostoc lactis]|uniref:hypothetical protein n=1 Tax=Leuconostoc lactis TaxID=1246 RepID=UPI0021BE991C|nr:hypothetical protein [Leuconostoc lactis]MCT8388323.1 hypothetical protein [Leuconostoc lactis]
MQNGHIRRKQLYKADSEMYESLKRKSAHKQIFGIRKTVGLIGQECNALFNSVDNGSLIAQNKTMNANYKHQPIGSLVMGPTVITSARIESLSGLKLY